MTGYRHTLRTGAFVADPGSAKDTASMARASEACTSGSRKMHWWRTDRRRGGRRDGIPGSRLCGGEKRIVTRWMRRRRFVTAA